MSIHDKYAEQRIAAAEHDLVEAHRRIHELEELVRGLYSSYHDEYPDRAEAVYEESLKELGIEVD